MTAYQHLIRKLKGKESLSEPFRSLSGCVVEVITKSRAKRFLSEYEWMAKEYGPKFALGLRPVLCLGLFSPGAQGLLGAISFGVSGGSRSADLCGIENRMKAICLERGACSHLAPPNAASFFIRRACRLAHKIRGWEIFYAYADETADEIGTVYQASNWFYLGKGPGDRVRLRPMFTKTATTEATLFEQSKQNTERLSEKNARLSYGSRAAATAAGWTEGGAPQKHKYVWFEGARRHSLKKLLRHAILPYPKRPSSE